MDTALSEPRELAAEKNHTSSDGITCSGSTRPEVNSLLNKIADTLSNIQQQPLPSAPTPLPPLPPFDPSALLNTLTSQGASIDSLLDSLTRVHGSSPLLSSMTAPPPPTSVLPHSHTLTPLTGSTAVISAGASQLPAIDSSVLLSSTLESFSPPSSSPGPLTNSVPSIESVSNMALPDPIFPQHCLPRNPPVSSSLLPITLPMPPSAPRGALAINGVPAVMATVVARSVSTSFPLSLPPPPSALIASALPTSSSGTPSPSSQFPSSSSIPPAFIATPLTTSHLPLPPPSSSVAIGSAVAPPPNTSATPPGNHVLSDEPFLSAPLPSLPPSNTNELIPQGPPSNELPDSDPSPILQALTNDLGSSHTPPPPDVQALVNELSEQGLPPDPQETGLQTSSVAKDGSQEPLPTSTETTFNEQISQGLPPDVKLAQPSPPSLHANEELLSDESDEAEMEGAPPTVGLIAPPPPVNAAGSRSDSASPYTDDASFASFVAGEAHDSGSAMDDEHFTPSPSPLPSMAQSIDALVSQMHGQPASSSSQLAMQAQFGVTAYCPRSPLLPPTSASPAPLDMTAQNFPKRSKYAHRAAMSAMHPYHRTRGGGVNVAKTLDLLKAVLQSSFNMEVKRLCDDYLQLYCQAAANIRENTGDTVPEATLRLLVNKMLEEAQHGYQEGEWEFPSGKLPRNEKVAPAKASPMAAKKVKGEKGEARYGPPKRSRRPPADQQAGSEKTSWKWSMDKKRVDPGKWKPDTLSPETFFVLGVNVNKALGHGANRGKVYYLHPELFKYACDGDDKTWLYENKLLPVHGGKAFLMILKEVKLLVASEECYRSNKEIQGSVRKLQEFQVPQFMLDKMKTFMRSVQGYFAQEASTTSSLPADPVEEPGSDPAQPAS